MEVMTPSHERRAARLAALLGPETEEDRLVRENPDTVSYGETWWRKHYEWLLHSGYKLRPRYAPDWTPPWQGTNEDPDKFEEGQDNTYYAIMDAVRVSDEAVVTLKQVDMSTRRTSIAEVKINEYLSSGPRASDPRNHSAQVSEVLQVPDEPHTKMLVMPFLRPFYDPRFQTFGEVVAFFTQLFEGLQFLHEHNIAHRDCTRNNIMMDATHLYPDLWHPSNIHKRRDWKGKAKHFTRTERPVKYYFIDYGLSERYNRETTPTWPPLELPVHGGDKSAPENQEKNYNTPCNPFATDVYYIGNLVRENFIQKYHGFSFMKGLVDDMVQDDPSKRPQADEVVARFAKIRKSLYPWQLRARTIRKKEWKVVTLWRLPPHVARTVRFIATRKPAIPDP
ncbi:hypothetical protein EVG20_g5027 [Dentipellis fragilis]|uniref:Protein kinase domain-containing protein n=1 Tax=Dentipellis fragilis TaxID=205917 RepID=A0A4Y9YWM3_9AGAM|nr:hypothetical protein EVG20_g5027 [Dentipellis fragilis]